MQFSTNNEPSDTPKKSVLPRPFDPKRSKYNQDRKAKSQHAKEVVTGEIPPYLKDEQKFKELIS